MFRGPTFRDQKKVNNFMLTFKPNPFPSPPASADFLENPKQQQDFLMFRIALLRNQANKLQSKTG